MRADPYAIGSSSLDKLPPKRAIPQAPSQLSAPVLDSLQYPPEQTTRTCIIAGNYLSAICHEMYARTQSYVCVVGKVEGGRPGYVRCGEWRSQGALTDTEPAQVREAGIHSRSSVRHAVQ